MRKLLLIALLGGLALTGRQAAAQAPDTTAPGPSLTLDEAIQLAVRNNPDHRQVLNNARTAAAAKRSAFGQLLPRADARFQSEYRKEGAAPINGVTFSTGSNVYQSAYWLGLNYDLSASTFLNPRLQTANERAVDADIRGSTENVRANVAQLYLQALQSKARAELQDSLVVTAAAQLQLARARLAVGSGTSLDVSRAEVTHGQQQVAAIQAHNTAEIDKLRLFQAIGVEQPANVQLTSSFSVADPGFSLDSLQALARAQNPTLNALRSRDRVANVNVKIARSAYLPSLNVATGWGGYTYQYSNRNFPVQQAIANFGSCMTSDSLRRGAGLPGLDCSGLDVTPERAAALRRANDQFPFDFTRQPMTISATLSLPLFDGLTREQRVEEARAEREDARYRVRARELQLTADVTAAYLTLTAQARAVALQEQNALKAREEQRLAEERYRVGAGTFLDVTEARSSLERAESERITAIYEFHKAFAALESAVGRPLR
ncbi:MAG TPA: TolC family protein [Gemmatimonadaceae bacterium]|nr:TolC family protein [Gemmatimonadaceae bacterium]